MYFSFADARLPGGIGFFTNQLPEGLGKSYRLVYSFVAVFEIQVFQLSSMFFISKMLIFSPLSGHKLYTMLAVRSI